MSAALKAQIQEFLDKCQPTAISDEEEIRRVEIQISAMVDIAHNAAEEKMPGWGRMFEYLNRKLERLQTQS